MNTPPEQLLAEWQEPSLTPSSTTSFRLQLFAGTLALTACMIGIGLYSHDKTYYLAAVAACLGGLVWYLQHRNPGRSLPIKVTTLQLVIGEKSFPLENLAGFWLHPESTFTAINIESKRASLFPITFLYPGRDLEPIRSLLLQVLPEVEARVDNQANPIGQFIQNKVIKK